MKTYLPLPAKIFDEDVETRISVVDEVEILDNGIVVFIMSNGTTIEFLSSEDACESFVATDDKITSSNIIATEKVKLTDFSGKFIKIISLLEKPIMIMNEVADNVFVKVLTRDYWQELEKTHTRK